jgi:hypothetical protein
MLNMNLPEQEPIDDIILSHIVFISHAGVDSDYIKREIVPVLREQNFDFHLENQLSRSTHEASTLYLQSITRSVNRCRCFIIVLSAASVLSEWVKYEVDLALARKTKKQIIPLIIADCDPSLLNPELCEINTVDFREDVLKAKGALAKRLLESVCLDAT